ncbi:MAG: hypothetical protein COT17_07155 [Elusimicrobia bacterium CG08_land_8_20_14_0_20_51_18]|nr:MAG: hypothetical protein COT17_07155 [Elusimicrobia bacterium CG08_land_8_20_14_0_20_51_18]
MNAGLIRGGHIYIIELTEMPTIYSRYWLDLGAFLLLAGALVPLFLARKELLTFLSGIPRKKLAILFFGIVLPTLAAMLVFGLPFMGISDEWEELFMGRLLSENKTGEFTLLHRHGFFYPWLTGLFFRFGTFSPETASYLTYAAAVCLIISVFLAAYFVFEDGEAALYSSAFYALSYFLYKNSVLYKGTPLFSAFCAMFTALLCISALRLKDSRLFAAALAAALLSANVRWEMALYVPLVLFACFYGLRGSKGKITLKASLPAVLILLPAVLIFILTFGRGTDLLMWLKPSFAGEFSLWTFLKDSAARSADLAGFWFNPGQGHILFLFLLPAALLKTKEWPGRREAFFLLTCFAAHNLVYILFRSNISGLEDRYAAMAAPLLFPFLGKGFAAIPREKRAFLFFLAAAFFAALRAGDYSSYLASPARNRINSWQDYRSVPETLRLIRRRAAAEPLPDPQIAVASKDAAYQWEFLTGLEIFSLQELGRGGEKIAAPLGKNRFFYVRTPELDYYSPGDDLVENYGKRERTLLAAGRARLAGKIAEREIYLLEVPPDAALYSCSGLPSDETYLLYMEKKEYLSAAGRARELLEGQPGNPKLFLDAGVALLLAGDPAGAEKELLSAAKTDENCAEAHLSLGALYLKEEKKKRAAESFIKAIETIRKNPDDYRRTGAALLGGAEKGLESSARGK